MELSSMSIITKYFFVDMLGIINDGIGQINDEDCIEEAMNALNKSLLLLRLEDGSYINYEDKQAGNLAVLSKCNHKSRSNKSNPVKISFGHNLEVATIPQLFGTCPSKKKLSFIPISKNLKVYIIHVEILKNSKVYFTEEHSPFK